MWKKECGRTVLATDDDTAHSHCILDTKTTHIRWDDNIRMDLQEVGCGYVDWIGLAQDVDRWRTLVSAVMNLRVP